MGEKLKNKYLVNTILSTQINDYYFFLMENMELGNLKSFNETKIDKCSELLCSFFIYQCLQGLYFMHSKLIVHRDIKLENILINHQYNIKLADFSMSTQLKENFKYPVSRSGTIPYLPPESFSFKKNKNNIDIKTKNNNKNKTDNNNNNNNDSINNDNKNIIINNNIANNLNNNNTKNNNNNNNIHVHKKLLSVEGSLKKDIFSLGIVMYRLLFREHPFNYEYKMDRETYGMKLKNTQLNFSGKELTIDCIEFIKGLLNHDINKRFNIDDALNHIWIAKTQKIINQIIDKNKDTNNFELISALNNYIIKENIEPIKNEKIILDYSTKDSEEKEKTFIKLKRKREDLNDNEI